jgi:hypothetical protein
MNALAPIKKTPGFLAAGYEQHGRALNRDDMQKKLELEPEAREQLSGHDGFAVVGIGLAGAGGAMIGTPLGMSAGGADNPPWILAGIGAACAVLGIVLGVVADNKLENAVDAHNQRFGLSGAKSDPLASPTPSMPATPAPAPRLGPIREVADLAHGVRLELLGDVRQFGANVELRFSRVAGPDAPGVADCGEGIVHAGGQAIPLPAASLERAQKGAELREVAQTRVPFEQFERWTDAGSVSISLCGIESNLTNTSLLLAKRFRQRFHLQLQAVAPH